MSGRAAGLPIHQFEVPVLERREGQQAGMRAEATIGHLDIQAPQTWWELQANRCFCRPDRRVARSRRLGGCRGRLQLEGKAKGLRFEVGRDGGALPVGVDQPQEVLRKAATCREEVAQVHALDSLSEDARPGIGPPLGVREAFAQPD